MRSPSWLLLLASTAMGSGAGCNGGDGPELHTFTKPEVVGMPGGNATGTTFSGKYMVTTAKLEACRCRVGSCVGVQVGPGAVGTATQQGGLFTFNLGAICNGGINQDGAFWCGAALEEPKNVAYGTLDGKISLVDDRPGSAAFTVEQTATATVNGRNFDCDFRTTMEATYQGPP